MSAALQYLTQAAKLAAASVAYAGAIGALLVVRRAVVWWQER